MWTPTSGRQGPPTSEYPSDGGFSLSDEEVARLHGKLSDHLLEQQNAMVAIIKQGRDTNTMMQRMMAESQQQFALCREEVKAMHEALLKLDGSGRSLAPVQPLKLDGSGRSLAPVQPARAESPRAESPSKRRFREKRHGGKKPAPTPAHARSMYSESSSSEEIDSDKEIQAQDHRFFKGSSRLLRNYDARGRPVSSNDDDEEVIPTVEEMDILYDDEPDKERPARDLYFSVCGFDITLTGIAEGISIFLVITNSFFTGMQANGNLRELHNGTPLPDWVMPTDVAFTVLFTLEFLIRAGLWGKVFFVGNDRWWTAVDLVCVLSSLVDMLVAFADLSFFRIVRLLRIARILRVFRGLRIVRDLRLLMASIMASLASFFWGIVLLIFTMYISAIGIMQSLVVVAENFGGEITIEIYTIYGTVFKSMLALFKAISGGKDWDDLLRPLADQSRYYTFVYIAYIMAMVLGVMNILTAVFCEQAAEIAKVDQALVIEDEINKSKDDREQLLKFFSYADKDGNGMISEVELEAFLKSSHRRAMLNLMDLDVAEARGLFDLMDADHLGYVPLESYIDTILRLRGEAKGHDIANLLFENRRLLLRLTVFMCYTNDNFTILFKELESKKPALNLDRYISSQFLHEQEKSTKVQVRRQLCSHLGAFNEDHDDGSFALSKLVHRSVSGRELGPSSAHK